MFARAEPGAGEVASSELEARFLALLESAGLGVGVVPPGPVDEALAVRGTETVRWVDAAAEEGPGYDAGDPFPPGAESAWADAAEAGAAETGASEATRPSRPGAS
jgi:hypothetical protein